MNIKQIGGVIGFTLKKYSPEILTGVGITGTIASAILACKATLKCEALLDEHSEKIEKIEQCVELAEEGKMTYTKEDERKDRVVTKVQTATNFVKLYGPSVTLMGASVGCILGAHHIMSKRNVALMAAYKLVEETFSKYRGRVVQELGESRDAHFRYGTDTVEDIETVVDEEGKKKKVKHEREEVGPNMNLTGFSRVFEEDKPDQYGGWTGSTQWSKNHEANLTFLSFKQQYFNDMLVSRGFVTVNDVLDELGFPRTEAGMIAGWRYKGTRGDGYISFQPKGIDGNWAYGKDGDGIILDFNIDGCIFDSKTAKDEMKK
jgi:hypothetical protein